MHLTDEQLNEYLDGESRESVQIELHLASCVDCAARLEALEVLFTEIESLVEVTLSKSLTVPVMSEIYKPAPLPPSLNLALVLQAVLAVVAVIIAAPFVVQFASSYTSSIQLPPLVDLFVQVQMQWAAWLDMLSQFKMPPIPEIPAMDVSSLFVMLTVAGVSLLWLVGNGLLLRNHVK